MLKPAARKIMGKIDPVFYRIILIVTFFIISSSGQVTSQQADILLKGGHVIDPKNNIDSQMDIAIYNGKIIWVAQDISPSDAKKVIDVKGLYVTPGLIDIHTHVFVGYQSGLCRRIFKCFSR